MPPIKMTPREVVISDHAAMYRRAMSEHIAATDQPLHANCLSCISFKEETEQCKKYNARPPARVIAFGCPAFFDIEEVPF